MKDITVNPETTIRQAMKELDRTAEKCLLVIDANDQLLGTLTDGDLRRSILAGLKFTDDISKSYNEEPIVISQNNICEKKIKHLLRFHKINLIPVLDNNQKIVDYVTWSNLSDNSEKSKKLLNVPVVIMAGGKGSRLEPFTKVLPKPLIPINEKPIIEHIIERFTEQGCNEFYLTINYKGRLLKAFFEDLQPDYRLHYIEEQEPLGTAGSLRFLDGQFNQSFFVTNCDVIVRTDYFSLFEFHKNNNFDLTLVASGKQFIIQYGICKLSPDGSLSHIVEKPKYDHLINTGLYVVKADVLKKIPKNKFYDITHLIDDIMKSGNKVGIFPIEDESWMDVGQWSEYQKTLRIYDT
jgi:dTDP-glucose pyrophosphorylase